MRIMKLTDSEDGHPVFVNLDRVDYYRVTGSYCGKDGTELFFGGSSYSHDDNGGESSRNSVTVMEPPERIFKPFEPHGV